MIHTKEEIEQKLEGLEAYVVSQKGFIMKDSQIEQVHQFITELKGELVPTEK